MKQKAQKKAIRESIEKNLIKDIQDSIIRLGFEPKKAKIEIKKLSKQIAKKLSPKVKGEKDNIAEPVKAKTNTARSNEHSAEISSVNNSEKEGVPMNSDLTSESQLDFGKRVVKGSTRNMNVDPLVLAEKHAIEKANAGEPDLDEQLGSVS